MKPLPQDQDDVFRLMVACKHGVEWHVFTWDEGGAEQVMDEIRRADLPECVLDNLCWRVCVAEMSR